MMKRNKKICESCGTEIEKTKKFCPNCNNIAGNNSIPSEKNSAVAIATSVLWAGLGQIYNGEKAKGFIIVITQIIFALLALNSFKIFLILPITLSIWSIYDAYRTSEIINFWIAIEKTWSNNS